MFIIFLKNSKNGKDTSKIVDKSIDTLAFLLFFSCLHSCFDDFFKYLILDAVFIDSNQRKDR